ncbi:MAG: hypothetical protein AAFU79_04685 [Myxococcota bacterium]
MGRLVAYIGPETNIASAVEGGSYSLVRQAEECHDGFAVAWYPPDDAAEPVRIRSRSSIRADGHLLEVPRRYASRTVLAGVRQLTSGVPSELSGVQPLHYGSYLFAQEGTLERFDEIFARPLLAGLSDEHFAALKGRSAGEVLFACWLDSLNGTGPDAMATALESVVGRVQEIATEKDVPASLALVATDGTCLLAVRTATHGPPPPLYTTVADDRAPVPPSGRLVASEPTFPGSWQSIDAHALMIFTVESGSEATTEAVEAPM